MPPLRTLFHPTYPWRFLKSRALRFWLRRHPSHRGACLFPPGHFYSPLLDLQSTNPGDESLPHDDEKCWEQVDLNAANQRAFYSELLSSEMHLAFPEQPIPGWIYHYQNDWFPLADAFLLSALMRRERPKTIIEVGSGFSTAVMLDTLREAEIGCDITCIEPYPARLEELLGAKSIQQISLRQQTVQTVPIDLFDTLESGDFLFIDSSHVAKVGSDVAFLFLRIIPRLKPGVWVHFHDIFYPVSYPMEWITMGRAWNESLILRAFLIDNPKFKVRAFNSFAAASFPQVFEGRFPGFLSHGGGSFWMQKV